jgi:hypothetical protein
MLRQLSKLFALLHAPKAVPFETLIRLLFYVTFANTLVLFFVRGGYDFVLGPLHVHAYSLRNWLILCFTLALVTTWLEGRRAGTSASEWIQSPLLLFLAAVLLYYSNGRTFESADTLSARFLPISLLRDHDFYLDEFSFVIDRYDAPYFVRRINNHLVSTYPPWGAVLALPVYLIPIFRGDLLGADLLSDLEKRAAVLITALSVLVLLFALRRVTRPRVAWCIAVIYAFGTSSFSTSSQALWQHGPSQLFLSLTLYCLVRGLETPSFIAWAGLPLGFAFICRPLNLVMALPIAAYVVHKHRGQLIGLILAGLPALLVFMSYNAMYFGSPFTMGFGSTVVSPTSLVGSHLSWFSTPLIEGLLGVLGSPARGLLIYSPIFLFSFLSALIVWRESDRHLLKYLSLAPFLLLFPVATLGGWTGGWAYGPRLLADATPFLSFLLYPYFERLEHKRVVLSMIVGLAVLSIFMHGIGVYSGYNFTLDGNRDHQFDVSRHPEVIWSWADSPPAYIGKQVLAQFRQWF